jgi:small subunit ribosomal protein S8e
MGISRDSRHKRRLTGGKRVIHQSKRQFELGRPMANTRIGAKRVHQVRTRGGNRKFRALRLDTGNFSWGTEVCTRKCRVLDVVYNASNNELVRTKTLVKNAIVQIDAQPFRAWYKSHYGVELNKKRAAKKKEVREHSFAHGRSWRLVRLSRMSGVAIAAAGHTRYVLARFPVCRPCR